MSDAEVHAWRANGLLISSQTALAHGVKRPPPHHPCAHVVLGVLGRCTSSSLISPPLSSGWRSITWPSGRRAPSFGPGRWSQTLRASSSLAVAGSACLNTPPMLLCHAPRHLLAARRHGKLPRKLLSKLPLFLFLGVCDRRSCELARAFRALEGCVRGWPSDGLPARSSVRGQWDHGGACAERSHPSRTPLPERSSHSPVAVPSLQAWTGMQRLRLGLAERPIGADAKAAIVELFTEVH